MLGIFGRSSKISILSVLILALFSTYNITYSQENTNEILTIEQPSRFDNWSIGIIGGLNEMNYNNSLFGDNLIGNGISNTTSMGLVAEYNFKNWNVALQTTLESYNFKHNLNGNNINQSIYAAQVGLKIYTGLIDNLYILPAVGLSAYDDQNNNFNKDYIKSISLGYEFGNSQTSAYFFQIGYGDLGGANTGMMLIKFGVRLKL